MARSITDSRQVTLRQFLQQITNRSAYLGTADAKPANQIELDNLLNAIDAELTPLLRMTASNPNDRVVSIGAGVLTNSETGFARSIPHVGALLPNFTSGTVTFPASSGGTITVSPGNNGTLTVSSGNYIKVLIYMDATGALNVLPGVENAVEANATVLKAPSKTLPIGYVTLQNVAGTIQNIAQSKIYQFGTGGGGSGSGTGTGIGSDLGSLTFRAEINDEFDDIPSASTSAVDITSGKTDSTTYSAANAYYRLAYDASRTVTGTGTSMTLSGTPSFTVKIGDMLIVGTEARRITALGSQTSYTIESAFTTNPSAAAATVSQAVYTKDLNNTAIDGAAVSAAISTTINQVMVDYEDTTTQDDVIFDVNTAPVIAFTASADGTNYSSVSVRPTLITDSQSIVNLPTAGTNLYIRFFANKSSGSGFVNILKHHAYFHRDLSALDGSQLNSAYCMTDGSGTEINCSAPSVVSGKTRVQLTTFTFPVGVNSGTTNGSLRVYLNGQKIPRFIDSTLTPDASYREIDQRTIELDGDYSSTAYSLEIVMDVAVVDVTDTNSTNITALQESMQQGFQGFVNENARLTATATSGTPAVGTFYSSIVNRGSIPDLTANLKGQMGIERIMTQQIYQIQNEFGSNGEFVWGLANDDKNQIRFVGSWQSNVELNGSYPVSPTTLNDFVEITFYGTGLNMLVNNASSGRDYRASVDGGAEGSNLYIAGSSLLINRNYAPNVVVSVVSGLSLGVHTVKIRNNASGQPIFFHGFEVITESSTIRLNPGSSFINGKKLSLNSQQLLAYNSSFESGILGTRGGRVVVYQKSDGTIGKAVQPTNASAALLASADHTNEEVARVYNFREFGANRTDDFSNNTANIARSFTLDDGTTSLSGSNTQINNTNNVPGVNASSNGDYLVFTFVGTGLDVEIVDTASGGSDSYTYQIDGGTAAAWPYTSGSTTARNQKIVSGLPYGTHTFRINRVSAATFQVSFRKFTVYQPKKPSIPSGAVELADYNVMADYVANTTAGLDTIGTGVIRKSCTREFTYVNGTGGSADWSFDALNPASLFTNLYNVTTDRLNAYIQYTFFGTGFEMRFRSSSASPTTVNVTLNGSTANITNFPTLASSAYGTGVAFNSATGVLDQQDAATTGGSGVSIRNLPLGLYTVRFSNGSSGSFMRMDSLDIITPIHSQRSNLYYDVLNTLPVGSCAISDNRKISPVKDVGLQTKNIAQALGYSSSSTSSTAMIPMPEMSVTHTNRTGKLKITVSYSTAHSAGSSQFTQIYVDGIPQHKQAVMGGQSGGNLNNSYTIFVPVSPGTHKIELYWSVNAGTSTTDADRLKILMVEEV